MLKNITKKFLLLSWLTLFWFVLLGNVHAWEVPAYLRLQSGVRLWFSQIDGDLIQNDRTKIGLIDNLGMKRDQLVWEYFVSARVQNIHQVRLRIEPSTLYDQSTSNSDLKIRNFRIGYDLDFYMTPQALVGLNADLDVMTLRSDVNHVRVGNIVFNYGDDKTRVIPALGLHGTFYPLLPGVALRPNVSTRLNWWDYESVGTWDWEIATGVDIPVNPLWTWSINGGYRIWNIRLKRDYDEVDVTRRGFFIETAVLF
ncbi:MAG: hypothetical protein P8182_03740 [Deltaproteobacteria bacterium]